MKVVYASSICWSSRTAVALLSHKLNLIFFPDNLKLADVHTDKPDRSLATSDARHKGTILLGERRHQPVAVHGVAPTLYFLRGLKRLTSSTKGTSLRYFSHNAGTISSKIRIAIIFSFPPDFSSPLTCSLFLMTIFWGGHD